jgi:hypothetical protein
VPGDLCKRRGGEIAATGRERLAVEARPVNDASSALLPGQEPERRGTDDPQPLRAESEQDQEHNGRVEFELTGCAVARVDS